MLAEAWRIEKIPDPDGSQRVQRASKTGKIYYLPKCTWQPVSDRGNVLAACPTRKDAFKAICKHVLESTFDPLLKGRSGEKATL